MLFVALIIISSRLIPRLPRRVKLVNMLGFFMKYCQNLMITKNKDKQTVFIHKMIKGDASKTTSKRTGIR